jgi:DNA-binding FadR family transcriptional regulator
MALCNRRIVKGMGMKQESVMRSDAGQDGAFRIPKTAEVVADHFRARIIRGELAEGDFLPPEGQLLIMLGISRPTLREALRVLETERLITIVRGSRSGAQVHRPKVGAVARYAGYVLQSEKVRIADIYEARLAIEPFVVSQLAVTRPSGATERLLLEADRMTDQANAGRYIDFVIDLAGFHRLLVEVSGNRTLLFLTRLLQDVLAHHQVKFLQTHWMSDDELRRRALWGIQSFRRLIELIDAGDPVKAEAHWRLHLSNANKSWVPEAEHSTVIDLLS